MTTFEALLKQALSETPLSSHQQQQIVGYLEQMARWNQYYNLTAIREPQKMVTHHIIDSLSLLPFISGQRILDVGSGAGLPGIPLAIVRPNQTFFLLDSNQKKTVFCQHVVSKLSLTNVTVVHHRVEDWQVSDCSKFDHIVTRAFGQVHVMLELSEHLCGEKGDFLAMKGKVTDSELEQIAPRFSYTLYALDIPVLGEKRTLVRVVKQQP